MLVIYVNEKKQELAVSVCLTARERIETYIVDHMHKVVYSQCITHALVIQLLTPILWLSTVVILLFNMRMWIMDKFRCVRILC